MQEVDGPAVLQNFSATFMEDLYGCVQGPFLIFFFLSPGTRKRIWLIAVFFFQVFLFLLLLQNCLKNGSLEICVFSVPENLCFESLLGTSDHNEGYFTFYYRTTTMSTFPFIHQGTFALSIKISAGLRVAALVSGSGQGMQLARARSKPTK